MTPDQQQDLYRLRIDFTPHDRYDYGTLEIGSAEDKKWDAAWNRATDIEKVRFCHWLANTLSRTAAGLADELNDATQLALVRYASHIVDPRTAVEWEGGVVAVAVPNEDAKRWLKRAQELAGEVVASDAAILAMRADSNMHPGVVLVEPTPETRKATT